MPVAVQFATIPEMFTKITTKFENESRPALMHKVEGKYVGISYAELKERVERCAFGLAALGLKRGDRVAIIAENRPEWVICDQAIVALGGVDVPIYPTMTARQNEYIFNDSGVKFAIVSNQYQLNKVLKILPEVKTLATIIMMNDKGTLTHPDAYLLSRVIEKGDELRSKEPEYVHASRALARPEDLLTIIYTSGTTGNPKGVMLTHRNLASNMISAAQRIVITADDVLLSFLPLCHSFERMAGYYTAFACGGTIAYAESIETVRDNLMEVRPTIVTTVPRLFERIHSRILKQVENGPGAKKKIFSWAIRMGSEYARAKKRHMIPLSLKLKHALADKLALATIRERTGGRMKFFVSGGAALAREFGEFFEAIGLTIIEGYGLTETSPVISANLLDHYKFGSVGPAIPGVDVKIADDGEILVRGPNVMKGYLNDAASTKEIIDKEGWLHTGDIGMMDAEGFIYITDRKKHLFVSSGGKNIAPQPIENLFLTSQYIEQFVLVGDRRMFLTALIVPDFDALKEYADAHSISYRHEKDLVAHKEINALIEKNISQIQKDLATYERVRKFALLDKPFSLEEGELTPTQKVRRKIVEERYAHLIDGMYSGIS